MGGDGDLAPMTEEQSASLLALVSECRASLPDPTARDIHDAMLERRPEMASWATAARVKKLNTTLNKEARVGGAHRRTGLEPDETDGPVVAEELERWPESQPMHLHLAAKGDSRIFRPSEHHAAVAGEDPPPDPYLEFRRTLATCAKWYDAGVRVWRFQAAPAAEPANPDRAAASGGAVSANDDEPAERGEGGGGGGGGGDDGVASRHSCAPADHHRGGADSLLLECVGARVWRRADGAGAARAVLQVRYHRGSATSGAHKRATAASVERHAGATAAPARVRRGALDLWEAHLTRNRYWEEKYGGGEAAGGEEARVSYVVTPAAEWFR